MVVGGATPLGFLPPFSPFFLSRLVLGLPALAPSLSCPEQSMPLSPLPTPSPSRLSRRSPQRVPVVFLSVRGWELRVGGVERARSREGVEWSAAVLGRGEVCQVGIPRVLLFHLLSLSLGRSSTTQSSCRDQKDQKERARKGAREGRKESGSSGWVCTGTESFSSLRGRPARQLRDPPPPTHMLRSLVNKLKSHSIADQLVDEPQDDPTNSPTPTKQPSPTPPASRRTRPFLLSALAVHSSPISICANPRPPLSTPSPRAPIVCFLKSGPEKRRRIWE